MVYIQDRKITEIRDRIRLEDLARDYNVILQPIGRRLRALCPFHGEKSPSFYIDAEKQVFHCFGCKAGGDVFTFIRQMEKVEFSDAVGLLARKAGISMEDAEAGGRFRGRGGNRDNPGSKVAVYEALSVAEEYYHGLLLNDPRGEPGRQYLTRRGIRPEMWKKFRLGYSLPEWDGLARHAQSKGISRETLAAAGLCRSPNSGAAPGERAQVSSHAPVPGQPGVPHSAAAPFPVRIYDYFRGRIQFPIADGQKRTIGFGARTLGDDQPKYLNSPRTVLFDKGNCLYGLPQARGAIEKEKRLAIVEGYTDAIMAHQEGIEFIVASLGTAFTEENARRLRRLAPRVDLIFDGDAAGQGAAERSLALLVSEDLDVRIYSVVNGKDPCDAILELGGSEFRRRLDADASGIFEFKWKRSLAAHGGDPAIPSIKAQPSSAAVARALDEVLELLARVPNIVARKLYGHVFAEKLGLDPEDIDQRLKSVSSGRSGGRMAAGIRGSGAYASGSAPGMLQRRDGSFPPAGRSGHPGGMASGQDPLRHGLPAARQPGGSSGAAPSSPENPGLEEMVLECLLADPPRARKRWLELPAGFFQDPQFISLARILGEHLDPATAGRESAGDCESAGGGDSARGWEPPGEPGSADSDEGGSEGGGGVCNFDGLQRSITEPEVVSLLARLWGRIEQRNFLAEVSKHHAGQAGGAGSSVSIQQLEDLWGRCQKEIRRLTLQQRLRQLEEIKTHARASGDTSASLTAEREYFQKLKELTDLRKICI